MFYQLEEKLKTFEVMPHIKDIQYEWYFGSNYHLVDKYLPLLPARTKYTLLMSYFNLRNHPDLDEKLRMLNWNDKRIDSIRCKKIQQLNIFIINGKSI